jgi:hypothetical protein
MIMIKPPKSWITSVGDTLMPDPPLTMLLFGIVL